MLKESTALEQLCSTISPAFFFFEGDFMKGIRKAVIPAAGYGTRFLPVTKAIPKEMFPIIDTPAIHLIVEEAIKSGIDEIIIIVSANKNAIIDYFDRNFELEQNLLVKGKVDEYKLVTEIGSKVNIHFIRQKEQLGLGHAVLQAKTFMGNEPFALLLGDDVYVSSEESALKQLVKQYLKCQSSVIGTMRVDLDDVSKFGICKTENDKQLSRILEVIEKPNKALAPSNLAIGGRYIFTHEIFDYLEKQEPGINGEIQLTDAIAKMLSNEKVYSYEIDAKHYDIGSRIGYLEAIIDFGLNRSDMKDQILNLMKEKINNQNY